MLGGRREGRNLGKKKYGNKKNSEYLHMTKFQIQWPQNRKTIAVFETESWTNQ